MSLINDSVEIETSHPSQRSRQATNIFNNNNFILLFFILHGGEGEKVCDFILRLLRILSL